MHSALYQGWVRHHRRLPKSHRFQYPLSLFYLDLDELPQTGLESKRFKLLQFRRSDYLRPLEKPLKAAVLDLVEARLKIRPTGKIRLLTNLRIFGLCFNPVSFYYCFDEDETLKAIVAEINNTPWNERFCYVLPAQHGQQDQHYHFAKDFHVSPFLPMDMHYYWRFRKPDTKLLVHMANHQSDAKYFSATLALKRQPLTPQSMRRFLWKSPFQTYRVVTAIYWQAFKLWLKRIPFYSHPKHQAPRKEGSL